MPAKRYIRFSSFQTHHGSPVDLFQQLSLDKCKENLLSEVFSCLLYFEYASFDVPFL